MADASPVTSPRPIGSLGFCSDMGSLESLSYAERQTRRSVFGLTGSVTGSGTRSGARSSIRPGTIH